MPLLLAQEGFDLGQIIFVVIFVLFGFFQWLFKAWQQKREEVARAKLPPPSTEEIEARRRAWQRQSGSVADDDDFEDEDEQTDYAEPHPGARPVSSGSKPPPLPTSSKNPIPPFAPNVGGLGDLIETFRKAVEESQQPQPQPSRPRSAPPPLPRAAATPASSTPPAHVSSPKVEPELQITYAPTPSPTHKPAPTQTAEPVAPASGSLPDENYRIKAQQANTRSKKAPQRQLHPLAKVLRDSGGYRKAFILKEVLDAPKALQKSPWPVE